MDSGFLLYYHNNFYIQIIIPEMLFATLSPLFTIIKLIQTKSTSNRRYTTLAGCKKPYKINVTILFFQANFFNKY